MSTVDPAPSGVLNIVTNADRGNGRVVTHVYQLPAGTTRSQATKLMGKWKKEDPDSENGVEVRYSVCESIRILEP